MGIFDYLQLSNPFLEMTKSRTGHTVISREKKFACMYSRRRISSNLCSIFLVKSQGGSTKIRTFNNLSPHQHFSNLSATLQGNGSRIRISILKLKILVWELVDASDM